MASSDRPETPLNIWASLARIRDLSRMVLAAIERDDLEEIERLSRESNALLAVVEPVLDRMKEDSTLPADIGVQLRELASTYQAITSALQERRDSVGRGLKEVRRNRARLKGAGLNITSEPSLIDRTT